MEERAERGNGRESETASLAERAPVESDVDGPRVTWTRVAVYNRNRSRLESGSVMCHVIQRAWLTSVVSRFFILFYFILFYLG